MLFFRYQELGSLGFNINVYVDIVIVLMTMESTYVPVETDSINPSSSACPLSEDGDTAFCDDLSETSEDRRSSVSTLDGSTDDCNEQQDPLKQYLQIATDSGWQQLKEIQETPDHGVTSVSPSASAETIESEFEGLTVRRSTSLKTYKTPPGSPHRKKEVRFADALGLDLESVRHIINTSEPPIVPTSATRHLKVHSDSSSSVQGRRRLLHPCFPQPGLSPNFAARVAERHVALHNFWADYDVISGTVCVANIAYEKRVVIRYTFDSWSTYSDVSASYVDGSNTGSTDLFRFSIHLPESCGMRCSFVEFSIMYVIGSNDEVYWDSNFGSNYRVDCYFT